MKKLWLLLFILTLQACTTKYILRDADGNEVEVDGYTEGQYIEEGAPMIADEDYNPEDFSLSERLISANDVFVVNEGEDFVTYQYKNVRVDEISPLASLYCADVTYGASPYLREVSIYHNGFMRATFDCVDIAI